MRLIPVLILLFTYSLLSCKKSDFITSGDAAIAISADTLFFDTVFTSTGSITRAFKIFNLNNQPIRFSSIRLMGADSSHFQTNINGLAVTDARDVELAANDSMYVFVTVYINPNSATLPFVVRDSIAVEYNSNQRFVQLEAYGRNARFLRNETISLNTVFDNTLPYVILGALTVDTNTTLTLQPGTELYFNADAPLLVDGTLIANGTVDDPIVFTGNRLDDYYRDLPGSWPGIYFRGYSTGNHLTFAHILNAYIGVYAGPNLMGAIAQLQMDQCIINNAWDAGLFLQYGTGIFNNLLIANCGGNLRIRGAGDYRFTHCTLAAYGSAWLFRTEPVVSLFNYDESVPQFPPGELITDFTNCIIWGDGGLYGNEVETDIRQAPASQITLNHTIYKADTPPQFVTFVNALQNADPVFDSIDAMNNFYRFSISAPWAPGVDAGTPTSLTVDLNNNNRNVGPPDLGAYEKQ